MNMIIQELIQLINNNDFAAYQLQEQHYETINQKLKGYFGRQISYDDFEKLVQDFIHSINDLEKGTQVMDLGAFIFDWKWRHILNELKKHTKQSEINSISSISIQFSGYNITLRK